MKKGSKSSFYFSVIAGAALSLAVLYLFKGTIVRLFRDLAASDDHSWGLLFPLVAAYIVYKKWPQVRSLFGRPAWLGLLVMAAGIFLNIVAELAAELYTTRLAFIVVLAGMLFLVGGWRLMRLLAFPLLLLILMIPLPQLVTQKLTLSLQLISSRLAAYILYLLGVPVFIQGNVIDLGTQQLQIVEACSGLRYVLGIIALGLSYCYFFQRRPWKVAVLLVSLIPVAILMNALRLVGIGFFPILKQDFWHTLFGWSIFMMFLDIIVGINWLLNRFSPPERSPAREESVEVAGEVALLPAKALTPFFLAGLALVLMAGPLVQRASLATPVPLRQSFNAFPMELGPWRGHTVQVDPEMVKLTQSHAHLNAEFTNPDHGPILLWMAYYETQKKAGGFVHSPKGCLTGTGWQISEASIVEIAPGASVNFLIAKKGGSRLVVNYWYLQRGRWLTSEYSNKLFMGYDGLVHRRTDGALIRLSTPANPDIKAAHERLKSFALLLVPILHKFIPD